MTVFGLAVASVLLWLGCFGMRRATINSREMEADIRRVFEGFNR